MLIYKVKKIQVNTCENIFTQEGIIKVFPKIVRPNTVNKLIDFTDEIVIPEEWVT